MKIAGRTRAVACDQQAVVVAIDTTIVSLAFEPSLRRKLGVISRNVRNDKPEWAHALRWCCRALASLTVGDMGPGLRRDDGL